MSLTQEQVAHIAKLSKLHLDPLSSEKGVQDLNSIVSYMDILRSIPASSFENLREEAGDVSLPELRSDVPVHR